MSRKHSLVRSRGIEIAALESRVLMHSLPQVGLPEAHGRGHREREAYPAWTAPIFVNPVPLAATVVGGETMTATGASVGLDSIPQLHSNPSAS